MTAFTLPAEADAVFEGGGVKGLAFAGAISVAEAAGVQEWKNVAGTSAGAIAACLLAVGYHANDLERILPSDYRPFADYGFGGLPRGVVQAIWQRGLAPGKYLESWLADAIAKSPRARERGKQALTFGDLIRPDLPRNLTDDERERAKYGLRIIASDLTAGRMLVLPQDVAGMSRTRGGPPLEPDELGLVEAVRMSMSYPYFFTPFRLWRGDVAHDIVDGGLLSNFPVWLFDAGSRPPARPTWGFRLVSGAEQPRRIRRVLWPVSMARAIFAAATGAWDRETAERAQSVRTVDIATSAISTLQFHLSEQEADGLREAGATHAERFFSGSAVGRYLQEHGWAAQLKAA
jgi:NTE family protein